jgi:hypothetical protein
MTTEELNVVAAFAVVVFTAVSCFYNRQVARETVRLAAAQTQPFVTVFLRMHDVGGGLFELVIANLGKGAAYDIAFRLPEKFPAHNWGMTESEGTVGPPLNDGPLVRGIPVLGPEEERAFLWGQWGGIGKYLAGKPARVDCYFASHQGGEQKVATGVLEIESFAGPRPLTENWQKRIHEEVRDLNRNVARLLQRGNA